MIGASDKANESRISLPDFMPVLEKPKNLDESQHEAMEMDEAPSETIEMDEAQSEIIEMDEAQSEIIDMDDAQSEAMDINDNEEQGDGDEEQGQISNEEKQQRHISRSNINVTAQNLNSDDEHEVNNGQEISGLGGIPFSLGSFAIDFGDDGECSVKARKKREAKEGNPQSPYKGVSWDAQNERWNVSVQGKNLGCGKKIGIFPFQCDVYAARIYDIAALKYHILLGTPKKKKNFETEEEFKQHALKALKKKIPESFQNQRIALIKREGQNLFSKEEWRSFLPSTVSIRYG